LEVTTRQFRDRQKEFLDLAREGMQIVIRRKTDAFVITPLETGDTYFSQSAVARIKKSVKSAQEGNVKTLESNDDIRKWLGL
jgi:hypothetical protein